MKNIFIFLFLLVSTKLCAQNNGVKKFFNKLTFDKTAVHFDNLKKGHNYTEKILVKNLTDKPMFLDEFLKDCGCFDATASSKVIAPKSSIIININIIKAKEGPLSRKVFIFFKNERDPVVIDIMGSFV